MGSFPSRHPRARSVTARVGSAERGRCSICTDRHKLVGRAHIRGTMLRWKMEELNHLPDLCRPTPTIVRPPISRSLGVIARCTATLFFSRTPVRHPPCSSQPLHGRVQPLPRNFNSGSSTSSDRKAIVNVTRRRTWRSKGQEVLPSLGAQTDDCRAIPHHRSSARFDATVKPLFKVGRFLGLPTPSVGSGDP